MHATFLIPLGHVYVIGAALEPYVDGLFPLKVAKEKRCVPNIILEREVASVAKFDYGCADCRPRTNTVLGGQPLKGAERFVSRQGPPHPAMPRPAVKIGRV
ncbi:hypothetical protein ACFX2I_037574 [Malus domestica]